MNGVEIHDMHPRGYLAFDLKEILSCLRQETIERQWRCKAVECTGDAREPLEAVESAGDSIHGQHLIDLAERTNQVIWGEFSGRLPTETTDSIVIKAIDSTLWEVFGNEDCLNNIRARFHDVRSARYTAT